MKEEDILKREISKRMIAVRNKYNLTQEDMASKLGIGSFQQYQKIEYGKNNPSLLQLKNLYENLGVSPNYIITGKIDSDDEYVLEFLDKSSEDKFRTFIEITKYTFGVQNCDFEIILKDKKD